MIAIKRVFQMTGPPPPHTIRCGQSWEDADVLLAALDLQPRDRVACVCSGGDSALTLLGAGAEQVVAIDPNPDQIACLALASMKRSAEHVCTMAGDADPACGSARSRVAAQPARIDGQIHISYLSSRGHVEEIATLVGTRQ